ncbi:MAG: HPr family phosphocarrier protein [Lachnospiraceae bacterium]|jgi:phosphotransferase system HPr-like phosphotransfer protein|nr:HPr family phosphocarrier protein [Lachnospiraceae bacterium]
MKTYRLNLNSIERVKGFVSAIGNMEGYFDLVSGRYVVDAKSIMGIFSMDLAKEVELRILETNEKISEIEKTIEPYLIR